MADGAVGLGLDQRRPFAAAAALHGLLHRGPHRHHVIAVHRHPCDAIGGSAGRDFGVVGDGVERRRRRVEVVFADEHHGRLQEPRDVQRLMETAMARRAIAEEGDADIPGAAVLGADRHPQRMRRPRGDHAVGAEQADRAVIEMHRAAPPADDAAALAVELGHQRLGVHSLGEGMAVAAMGGGDPVGGREMGADAGRHRFLADIEMQEARRFAGAAGDLCGLLEAAEQHHLLVEPQHFLGCQTLRQRRLVFALRGGCFPGHATVPSFCAG